LSKSLRQGARIEAFYDPERGLSVDVNGEEVLTVKEFHMFLSSSDGQVKIRCHEKHGDIDEWHDIHVSNIHVYSAISRGES